MGPHSRFDDAQSAYPDSPSDLQHVRSSSNQQDDEAGFEFACHASTVIFKERNREYGGAFRKYGLLGVIFEILGILNRLPAMTIWKNHGDKLSQRKLYDLFIDLHNYSNMAMICLEDNNWDGLHPIVEGETDANSST
jgi:hypothetical protein